MTSDEHKEEICKHITSLGYEIEYKTTGNDEEFDMVESEIESDIIARDNKIYILINTVNLMLRMYSKYKTMTVDNYINKFETPQMFDKFKIQIRKYIEDDTICCICLEKNNQTILCGMCITMICMDCFSKLVEYTTEVTICELINSGYEFVELDCPICRQSKWWRITWSIVS